VTAASPQLVLAEAPNFRDFGGIDVGGGRRTRAGVLYRSEGLDELSAADVETLAAIGFRLVCDLRTSSERERHRSRLPEQRPAVMLAHPASEAVDVNPEGTLLTLEGGPEDAASEYMLRQYRAFPSALATTAREIVDRMLAGEVPVLIHCAAGKDRTGFVCSMLLYALGASDETIEAEYLRSDDHYGAARIASEVQRRVGRPADPNVVDGFRVRTAYLEAAFSALRDEYGSFHGYLEQAMGLTPERREALSELLTAD